MKNSILLILIVALFHNAGAQSNGGLEHYCYFAKSQGISLVSMAYFQNAHNWYAEVRYNYEEKKTMSIYGGKTFYREGKFSFMATPMLGLLIGEYRGGSVGTNLDVSYKKIELSSQVQYVFSQEDKNRNFVLNWSELSYEVVSFMKVGIALQQSTVYRSAVITEPGGFIGLSYRNWELPIYVFSPAGKYRNYVIGLIWEWQHGAGNKNHSPAPSLKGRRNLALELNDEHN